MPPRYAYWTIVAGGLPTAFRTTEREELLPTFRRIKQKHPDTEMKYFARGRLWRSPDEARAEAEARRATAALRQGTRGGPPRGRDWRPGGKHEDPRQKFTDAKKERNLNWRKDRFDRRQKSASAQRPGDDAPARPAPRAPRGDKPEGLSPQPWNDRGPRKAKPPPSGDRPWRDRPPRGNQHGELYRGKPKSSADRPPAARPKGSYGAPKPGGVRKPEPWPRAPRSGNRPPDTDRNPRRPAKDKRRRS